MKTEFKVWVWVCGKRLTIRKQFTIDRTTALKMRSYNEDLYSGTLILEKIQV